MTGDRRGWRGRIPNGGYIREVNSREEGKGGDMGLVRVVKRMGEQFHDREVEIVGGREDIGCSLS